jgi:Transglycosylase SLT domain
MRWNSRVRSIEPHPSRDTNLCCQVSRPLSDQAARRSASTPGGATASNFSVSPASNAANEARMSPAFASGVDTAGTLSPSPQAGLLFRGRVVSVQSPPVLVRRLRADERVLQTATGARFVSVARDRQLLIRVIAADRSRAAAVAMLAPGERDDLAARRDLDKLSAESPPQVGGVSVGPSPPAGVLHSFYREAQQRFGIRWQLLAAINFVESDFGRARTTARADAQGPMQFEPATWRRYGMGGRVDSPRDAILAAANLLKADGGRANERAALLHYNLSPLYGDAVLHLADRMATVPTAFREYYDWKLYLRKR